MSFASAILNMELGTQSVFATSKEDLAQKRLRLEELQNKEFALQNRVISFKCYK